MVQFSAIIKKFGKQGEKTGWSYISVPPDIAGKLKPGNKKSFRVKGKLDDHTFTGMALMPMGDGSFIMALNERVRKAIHKNKGATLKVQLTSDEKPIAISKDLLSCLQMEPEAQAYFNKLPPSHRHYYSKWIEDAKTAETKTKRLTRAMKALSNRFHFGEMMRWEKEQRSIGK